MCVSAAAIPLVLMFPAKALAVSQCFWPGGDCNFATLYINQDQESTYSTAWTSAHVFKTANGHLSRITFIDGSGNWSGSNADTLQTTASGTVPATYNKKAYCKNIDDHAYLAKCTVGG